MSEPDLPRAWLGFAVKKNKPANTHTHTHSKKIHSHRLRLCLPLENFIYMSIYSKVQVHDAAVKLPVCLSLCALTNTFKIKNLKKKKHT